MISRRAAYFTSIIATAASCFTLGVIHTRGGSTDYDARLEALRQELQVALAKESRLGSGPTGTNGVVNGTDTQADARARMISEIKEQLQNEMGLFPLHLLRDRQSSFVELYSYDSNGQKNYGTAGYLGNGYFVTVKHAVVALKNDSSLQAERKITSLKIIFKGKEVPAKLIDAGSAQTEVDPGDWAIIRTRNLELPPLTVDIAFPYEFADPIFRLGNDYSKGISVSTGYVGQKTTAGLVTALTDGHPGVSGGGVLDQRGVLVGIPIGRMQGDYRFSFILPMRAEMFRKVPQYLSLTSDGGSDQ